jgi:hypothetical protein
LSDRKKTPLTVTVLPPGAPSAPSCTGRKTSKKPAVLTAARLYKAPLTMSRNQSGWFSAGAGRKK